MKFIYLIIDLLWEIGEFFWHIYFELVGWDWIPDAVPEFFYELHVRFTSLAFQFDEFAQWLEWAEDELGAILSWSNIRSLIRGWLEGIELLVDWFTQWRDNVTDVITNWWQGVEDDVKRWIDIATQGLDEIISDWNNFWTAIFPTLVDFTWLEEWWNSCLLAIQNLIESAFTIREGLWEGWQDWRDKVAEFFTDPLQWCYNKLDEFFERFW